MSRFYLNDHELPGVIRDQIGFKERCFPVFSNNVKTVTLEVAGGSAFPPPSNRKVLYAPLPNAAKFSDDP